MMKVLGKMADGMTLVGVMLVSYEMVNKHCRV
jgi:hypothetical protein